MPAAAQRQTGVGVATAADVLGMAAAQTAVWDGLTVTAAAVLVKCTYADGGTTGGKWGMLTMSEQSHSGAVGGSGTPTCTYTYDDGASGGSGDAKYVRLSAAGYPGASRGVSYNYDSTPAGRLDNLADDSSGTTKYAQYTYLGAVRSCR